MQNLFRRMEQLFPQLTPSSQKIVLFLRENAVEAQYLSITGLASASEVSQATVFRFCRNLGFNGFNDFKLALAKSTIAPQSSELDDLCAITETMSVREMAQQLLHSNSTAMQETLDLIDEDQVILAAEWLSRARRIYCFGQGGSQIVALEAWSRFLTISNHVYTIQDSHLQVIASSLLEPNDVILFVSYSGSTKDSLHILKPARERGAKIILISHYPDAPAARCADLILQCGSKENPLQTGSISARIAMLFVVDILVHEYARRHRTQVKKNMEITAHSLSAKHH